MPHLVSGLLRVFDGVGHGLAEEFTVALAQRVAESNPMYRNRKEALRHLAQALERSRLAEDLEEDGKLEEERRVAYSVEELCCICSN